MKSLSNNNKSAGNDEIDLKIILNFFNRNKGLIGIISFLFFVTASLYSLTIKKTWKGEFQIVLDNKKTVPLNVNSSIQNLIGLKNNDNDLNTNVGILKSPSVLMPIFEYVISQGVSEKEKKGLVFSKWRKGKLKVELVSDTSILNISYMDSNKKLIIPVLEKISSAYQEYSGKNKQKYQTFMKNFLNNQIGTFNVKSAQSLKVAQEFATNQDLLYPDNTQETSDEYNDKKLNQSLIPNIKIENIRVQAANEIRKIDLQTKDIEEIDNDIQKLQYIASSIPAIQKEGLIQLLSSIEGQIAQKKYVFTDSDLEIIRLNKKKDIFISLLKKKTLGALQAKRLETEAIMKAAMRPKGVLLKYKELIREAERDERTLIQLENQLRAIELDEAKQDVPWELITKPTLLKNSVGPKKKRIAFIGLFIGFFLGTTASFYKEKKLGKVLDLETLEKLISFDFAEKIEQNENFSNSKKIVFIKDFINSRSENNRLCLISIDNNSRDFSKRFKEFISQNKDLEKNMISFNSVQEVSNLQTNDINLLIIKLNQIRCADIKKIDNRLKIFNSSLSGVILIE